MKICPNCQTRYTDDSLQFCLQDGTALQSNDNDSSMPTVAFNDEQETIVKNRTSSAARFETQNYQQPQTANCPPETKKNNTMLAIVVTVLAMLLVFAIGIAGWLYFKNKNEVASNQNAQNSVQNSAKPTATPTAKPSVKPSASATATPSFDAEELKADVSKSVNAWRAAAESIDLDEYMTHYATAIDYYNKKQTSVATVRADKEKAFSNYDSMQINLGNINVTPDATGENATAVFDKEWRFENAEKVSEGKVQTQLQMKKISGDWKITGEKDLKVYYTK